MSETNNTTVISIPPQPRRLRWTGAKPIPLAIVVLIGLIVYFVVPIPAEISKQSWRLLATFMVTIAGLVLGPLPLGGWAFVCLTVSMLTQTLSVDNVFESFSNESIWLIVVSCFFSRGFVKTGLGERLAMHSVRLIGESTLGLTYGLVICETILSPAVPSATARAAGVFMPMINSLAIAGDSRPNDASARKIGAFLVVSQIQSCTSSTSIFLTAEPHNLLCVKLAESLGVQIKSPWITWFKASCIPAIVSVMLTPFIVYMMFPPETKHTPNARILANNKLEQMGPVKRNEWIMLGTMLVTVSLWIFADRLGISSLVVAMLGLSVLLVLGVLSWDDCLSEKSAWDILAWFSMLMGMSTQLTVQGIIPWVSTRVATFLKSLSVGWHIELLILQSIYFFMHYLFAGQITHIGALYSAFVSMHLRAKVPPSLSALLLGFNTNLFGALTHYSSGQAAVYYGAGYVKLSDVFRLGILMAAINISIWGLTGALWWKIVGLY